MKPSLVIHMGVLATVAAIGAVSALPALAATAEIIDLKPEEAAMVARHKINQRGLNRLQQQRQDALGNGNNADCGTVSIGNQQDNSARGRINPRNSTVIVTGPVINTANCR